MQDEKKTSADLIVDCLKQEGVFFIFGIPGEENIRLISAIKESPIRFILTRHEQGAAFMADIYGRLTGKAGVVLPRLDLERSIFYLELPMPKQIARR